MGNRFQTPNTGIGHHVDQEKTRPKTVCSPDPNFKDAAMYACRDPTVWMLMIDPVSLDYHMASRNPLPKSIGIGLPIVC